MRPLNLEPAAPPPRSKIVNVKWQQLPYAECSWEAAADLPAEAITRYEAREGGETAELDAAVVPKEPAAPPPTAWVKKDMELEVAPLINS